MPLQPVAEMAGRARAGGYAIGYFEAWSLESLYGVVEAAESLRAPVFIGVNGEFLSRPERASAERLSWWAALGRAAAEDAKIPCGLVFNECSRDAWTRAAATAGFNLVMPADPEASYEDYRRRVGDIVRHAHPLGVAVEAELGELPSGAAGFSSHEGEKTDPRLARDFVAATGVDLLAVSVGNIHGSIGRRVALDFEHLKAIHRLVDVPLVLHGGTGIADESLREAAALGVAKVNFGAGLKLRYLAAVRRALANDEANPHVLLGMGGPEDVATAGRRAVREATLERMPALGCAGKA